MTEQKHCRTCRHHSLEQRPRIVYEEGADEEEMLAEHDGSPEDNARHGAGQHEEVFSCMKQGGKTIGIGDEAGVGCSLFELGSKGALNVPPHIAARLKRFE